MPFNTANCDSLPSASKPSSAVILGCYEVFFRHRFIGSIFDFIARTQPLIQKLFQRMGMLYSPGKRWKVFGAIKYERTAAKVILKANSFQL